MDYQEPRCEHDEFPPACRMCTPKTDAERDERARRLKRVDELAHQISELQHGKTRTPAETMRLIERLSKGPGGKSDGEG